jgi:hypothetical protein
VFVALAEVMKLQILPLRVNVFLNFIG